MASRRIVRASAISHYICPICRATSARRLPSLVTPSSAASRPIPSLNTSSPTTSRTFSTSQPQQKKGGKQAREEARAEKGASSGPDPFDFSELEAGITRAHEQLKEALSKLRAGGRFNPETVESLRVSVVKGSKSSERLADLAQVVPRGRTLQIIVGDKEHVKPVSSAIQTSKLNLNPQPDAQNPAQLNITLPPPTAESRKEAVNAAVKAAQTATTAVQSARAAQQKKLKAMSGRPDDLRKAGTQMEKLVEKGVAEVKKIADSAKKVLESG